MKGLDKLVKNEAFAQALAEAKKAQSMFFQDYMSLVDDRVRDINIPSAEDQEEVFKILNNMVLSYKMNNLTYKELMLVIFRLASHMYGIS